MHCVKLRYNFSTSHNSHHSMLKWVELYALIPCVKYIPVSFEPVSGSSRELQNAHTWSIFWRMWISCAAISRDRPGRPVVFGPCHVPQVLQREHSWSKDRYIASNDASPVITRNIIPESACLCEYDTARNEARTITFVFNVGLWEVSLFHYRAINILGMHCQTMQDAAYSQLNGETRIKTHRWSATSTISQVLC